MLQLQMKDVKNVILHHLEEKYGKDNLEAFRNQGGKAVILDLSSAVMDGLNQLLVEKLASADEALANKLGIPTKRDV